MSIQTAVYNALAADPVLKGLLAVSTIDSARPAIYEAWAPHDTPMPYINLTFSAAEGNHWAKRDAALYVDIFSDLDSTEAEQIRNRILYILDRQKIELEDGNKARIHSDTDGLTTETEPGVTHWEITFSIYYWRQAWATYSE